MTYEEARAEAIRRSHERWTLTRSRGIRRFALVHGVLWWGGIMAFGNCLGQFITGRFHPVGALATSVLFAVLGYPVGVIRWKYNEEAYRTGRSEEIG